MQGYWFFDWHSEVSDMVFNSLDVIPTQAQQWLPHTVQDYLHTHHLVFALGTKFLIALSLFMFGSQKDNRGSLAMPLGSHLVVESGII